MVYKGYLAWQRPTYVQKLAVHLYSGTNSFCGQATAVSALVPLTTKLTCKRCLKAVRKLGVCVNCLAPRREHFEDKCLFEPSTFEEMT